MKKLQEYLEDLEEVGQLHEDYCMCVQKVPDACNCTMFGFKEFISQMYKELIADFTMIVKTDREVFLTQKDVSMGKDILDLIFRSRDKLRKEIMKELKSRYE